jgi:hypothetical protein
VTSPIKSNAAAFDSVVDAIGDLVERLVDASVRLSQLEAMAEGGNDIVRRIEQLEARMTKIEKGRFRFPVSLIINKTSQPDFAARAAEGERFVEMRSRVIGHDERLSDLETRMQRRDRNDVNTLTQQDVARCHKRLDEDSATFDKMRTAFKAMTERLAAVEARVATPPNREP